MLASTERSLEIERQRRRQLRLIHGCSDAVENGRDDVMSNFCFSQNPADEKRKSSVVITTAISKPHGLTKSQSSDHDHSVDDRKGKNVNRSCGQVRIRRYGSAVRNATTPSNTSSATLPANQHNTQIGSAKTKNRTPSQSAGGRRSTRLTRRWNSLREISRPSASHRSQTVSQSSCRSSGDGRSRDRRSSRLDRHVYQCYFAGILHSSRRSGRFIRLQQLYEVLENIVKIETELLVFRQQTTSTNCRETDEEYCRQRSAELQKLYAKLDAAQENKEFFYDNGHTNAFQWKPWKDTGLNNKTTSLATLKNSFEVPMSSKSHEKTHIMCFQQSCSYKKLLRMFQRLEKRTREEAETWLQWQTWNQQPVDSGKKLDGTYIQMMQTASKNAKSLALHGYHMNEHRNRYDAYVQSRRIYRPKSAPNIFEQPSSDDEQLGTNTTQSDATVNICDSNSDCFEGNSDLKQRSSSDTDFLLTTSGDYVLKCLNDSDVVCPTDQQAHQTVVSVPSPTTIINENYKLGHHRTAPLSGDVHFNYDETTAKSKLMSGEYHGCNRDELDPSVNGKSKRVKRDKCRPRSRSRNEKNSQIPVVNSDTTTRRHIDAWRRSSRRAEDAYNTALDYFNSRCIDDIDQSDCKPSAVPSDDTRQTRKEIKSAEVQEQLATDFDTSAQHLPVYDREKKFSTEIKLSVSDHESLSAHDCKDRRKTALPPPRSANDIICYETDFSTDGTPKCSRAMNIDKQRSRYAAAAKENLNGLKPGGANAKTTQARTAGIRAVFIATTEARPSYVTSAPIMHMLSESEPIHRNIGSLPVFIDCRQAVARKLPTLVDLQNPADGQVSSSACPTMSASGLAFSNAVLSQNCPVTASEPNMVSTGSPTVNQTSSSVTEFLPDGGSDIYFTTTRTSEFACNRCHRASEFCQSAMTNETGNLRRLQSAQVVVDQSSCNEDPAPPNSKDTSVASAARDRGREVQLNAGLGEQPELVRNYHRRLLPTVSGRLGPHELEMKRIMDSLDTINIEWTTRKPTRSTQFLDLAGSGDTTEPRRQPGIVSDSRLAFNYQHASQSPLSTVQNSHKPLDNCETNVHDGDSSSMNSVVDCANGVPNSGTDWGHIIGTEKSRYDQIQRLCALYNYRPRHSDELELNKGDIIQLRDVCDDGWYWGTSVRTQQFGTFPGNYVRPIT